MSKYVKQGLLCLFACCLVFLAACGGKKEDRANVLSVTIEPQRYVAERIAGAHFRINVVVPSGQSPETYDPTPQEMMRIGRSRAYLRIGSIGFEQAWMPAITGQNPDMPVFDLSNGVELVPSTPVLHEEEGGGHHHHGLTDPHIWTSAQNMKVIARNTLEALLAIDRENEAAYTENYHRLLQEIEETERTLDTLLAPLRGKAFIIYHPALTYLARDYGLRQLCIEMDGKEPSPAQLQVLVDAARAYDAAIVFIQQEFDQKNAELIAKETGCRLVPINPLAYDWKNEMVAIARAIREGTVHQ